MVVILKLSALNRGNLARMITSFYYRKVGGRGRGHKWLEWSSKSSNCSRDFDIRI